MIQVSAACNLFVNRVIDGDTFHSFTVSVVSPSVHVREETGFRLLRVDTPERKQPGYQEAKDYLNKRINGKMVEVQLTNKRRKRDSFGRFLAEVFVCEAGRKININDEILKKGLGVPFRK